MDMMKELLKEVAAHPGASEILIKANNGELTVAEAALQIQELIEGTSTGDSLVQKLDNLNDMGIDPDKMVFKHPNGEEGLNPLFEAKLAERLSQDGDIPELRVGPLPEGCRPAVPVLTYTSNPVAIGLQLNKARETVEKLLSDNMVEYIKGCEENRFLVPPSPPIDLPDLYQLGKKPLPMKVDPATPKQLLKVSDQQKRELIHSCIGTTQGRVSCVAPIQAIINKKLQDLKIKIKVVKSVDCFETEWTCQTWGPEDISEDFNPITTAAFSMLNDFLENQPNINEVYIHIRPINGYSDRVFGWKTSFYY